MIVVRAAVRPDARDIADIHVASRRAAYSSLFPPGIDLTEDPVEVGHRWDARLDPTLPTSAKTFVATDGARIVGFTTVRTDDSDDTRAELLALYVRPMDWGRSVGRMLLARGYDAAVLAGKSCLSLWVVQGNVRARTFYERNGCAPAGAIRLASIGPISMQELEYRDRCRADAQVSNQV